MPDDSLLHTLSGPSAVVCVCVHGGGGGGHGC